MIKDQIISSNHRTRPSISSWFSRSSFMSSTNATSVTTVPSRAVNISDPIIDSSRSSRMGPLGQGATVVSTPQEALSKSNGLNFPSDILEEVPELESLPSEPRSEEKFRSLSGSTAHSTQDQRSLSSRYPSIPPSPSRRPSSRPITPPPPIHSLPTEVILPAFNPILLEFNPENVEDPAQAIVILDTATETYRTTWSTLTAHPSNLSRYLQNLLIEYRKAHDTLPTLTLSDGQVRKSRLGAHIFLDRPSSSYSHILHYMRSPFACPSSLPWAIQLEASPSVRVESLLALRDEAKYLDLDQLCRLCCEELGIECINNSPGNGYFQQIEDVPRENHHQRKRASVATTAVESPVLAVSSIVLDDYFPSAAVLKARTRSNSRSSKVPPIPPPKAQSGWI